LPETVSVNVTTFAQTAGLQRLLPLSTPVVDNSVHGLQGWMRKAGKPAAGAALVKKVPNRTYPPQSTTYA
jgi:hypothetical protein